MTAPGNAGDAFRSIRSSEEEVDDLINRIDSESTSAESAKRASTRFNVRTTHCKVVIQQPGSAGAQPFLVPTRNLSAGGVSFLHGGFVHVGSTCSLTLCSETTCLAVKGEVVRCRYLENMIHEIAVKFDEPIQAALFSPNTNRASVLVIDPDAKAAGEARHHLDDHAVDADWADCPAKARELASGHAYDAVLFEPKIDGLDVADFIRQLREDGFGGPIIAVSSGSSEAEATEAGCCAFFKKPYTTELAGKIQARLAPADDEESQTAA